MQRYLFRSSSSSLCRGFYEHLLHHQADGDNVLHLLCHYANNKSVFLRLLSPFHVLCVCVCLCFVKCSLQPVYIQTQWWKLTARRFLYQFGQICYKRDTFECWNLSMPKSQCRLHSHSQTYKVVIARDVWFT